MKYYIFLDSSNINLAVGISNETTLLETIIYPAWQCQSEYMIPELKKLFDKFHVSNDDISRIYVAIGPGSYTGVRISLTISKVISLALKCDVYPVSSLQILKDNAYPSICLINARSNRSYFGVYKDDFVIEKDQIKTNQEVIQYIKEHNDYHICGDCKYLQIEGVESNIIEQMFSLKDKIKPIENPIGLKPIYLKD